MLSSNLEVRIHHFLEELDIPFEEEYIFDDLISTSGKHLRFDYCIFDDDGSILCLIEAQGIQHYMPRKAFGGKKGYYRQAYNDTKKKEYCLKNGLRLICIPYVDEFKIDGQYLMNKIYG